MANSNVEVVKGAYEAFGRGDVPAVLGAMTDDIEWNESEGMPYGGAYNGPQEIADRVFAPIVEDVPDFKPIPEELFVDGDTVVVLARYTGTGKATGQKLDIVGVHVWELRDGKLARFRQFIDTVKYAEVVPADATVAT